MSAPHTPHTTRPQHLVALLAVSLLLLSAASAQPYSRNICADPRRMLEPAAQRICNFVVAFKNIGDFTDAMEDLLDAKGNENSNICLTKMVNVRKA